MAMKTSAVPQNAQSAVRPRSNYALFLGDLSIFCCEKDIEDAFASYGEIVNVRIQRSKETSRALSYGFIEFSCETAAVTAMNEMNSFVLKGRPLRIRWAAKRNQPVKSENAALHTAATIFVKFASQTGIIVSEQLMREHFSVFGQILDATIRTITIDEAYNRSKGYGFVNFVNDETQDGLAVAYKAAADLQNATVSGVNYRCEVGHKHQPNKGAADSDSVSMGAYSSGAASMAVSASSASRASFLPSISPKHGYYAGQQQMQHLQVQVHSGASVNSANSHSSSGPAGPSSPHPAAFYPVNAAAQQAQQMQHGGQGQGQGAMSSNASVGSGSASGVYAPAYSTSPHSPHPVSTIVSTISFVPTPGMPTMPNMPNIYTQGQAGPSQGGGSVYGSPTHAQSHYTPAQQQYFQQQQQFLQQQYFAQQQQQQGHAGQYYAQQQGMYPQHPQQQQAFYGAQQGAQGQTQQGGYYPSEQYPPHAAAAAQAQQQQQQYYAQGYYAPSQQHGPGSVSGGSVGSHGRSARSSASYEASGAFSAEQGQQQQQAMRPRRVAGLSQPMNQNYMQQQQQASYYGLQQQQQQFMQPVEVAQPSNGRRSQRNVSNQSNISEITSATLNELDQGDDEEEEEEEDCDQDQAAQDEEDNEAAAANAAAMISGLRMDSTDDASVRSPTNANTTAAPATATATPQMQAPSSQPINCKLSERRRRNVSGGSNTTEITAEMLYDLQQQEQRLEQEEEEGNAQTPQSQPSSPVKSSVKASASKSRSPAPGASPRSPRLSANKGECSPPPGGAGSRARESSTASIAPFTMSAQALDELQKQAEAADALSKDRRTKRSSSERSNQSDITAALAYMGLDNSSAEQQFRALEDQEEDAASSAENSVSVCICGKALDASARQSAGSPYASSCPYGTSACSCVYKATY